MKITGIVAEYNPFHNGHAYQIQKARELTGCDAIVVAMSGDFLQRGTPAIIDKEHRTIAALKSGADMVLQIPVSYSTASAEAFAYGSVALLAAAGIDTLVFGCETTDIQCLEALAHLYVTEPPEYKSALQAYLKDGKTFPTARSMATLDYLDAQGDDLDKTHLEEILKQPNNILGIEYLKALHRLSKEGLLSKPIEVCPIPRIGTGYHSLETCGEICSATALRDILFTKKDATWKTYVPTDTHEITEAYLKSQPLLSENDFSAELKFCILKQKESGFASYMDSSAEISNRILNCEKEYTSFADFCKRLQTKDTTYARISRILTHILLDVKHLDAPLAVPYIRVLGFNKEQNALLSYISKQSKHPLVTNAKDAAKLLTPEAMVYLKQDLFARELYLSKIQGKTDYQFPVILSK